MQASNERVTRLKAEYQQKLREQALKQAAAREVSARVGERAPLKQTRRTTVRCRWLSTPASPTDAWQHTVSTCDARRASCAATAARDDPRSALGRRRR